MSPQFACDDASFEKTEFAAPMDKVAVKEQGVGARLVRKEDDRLLRGRGQFVADIRFAGMKDVAFVRSPLAHARLRGVTIPDAHKKRSLHRLPTSRASSRSAPCPGIRGFKPSEQPLLATTRCAMSASRSRCASRRRAAQAEDIAGTVVLDLEELPAVHDMLAARDLIGRSCTSIGATTSFSKPSSTSTSRTRFDAPIKVTREIRTARQCMAPIEGRGVVAHVGFAAGTADDLLGLPDAAHRAHRPGRMPRPR